MYAHKAETSKLQTSYERRIKTIHILALLKGHGTCTQISTLNQIKERTYTQPADEMMPQCCLYLVLFISIFMQEEEIC
jgi:hypothetical protein